MSNLVNYYLSTKHDRQFLLLFLFITCLLTYIIYSEAIFYGESSYDDVIYFKYLRELLKEGITFTVFFHIFSDYVNSNYHPLTVLSLAIDYIISGGNPIFFHVTNTIIHICNAMMVFFIFTKLAENRMVAVLTALLFVVHPLNVETVVWISERKGLLSVFFALVSLYYYITYKNEGLKKLKVVSVTLFMLSLLSKPTTVTMPAIFILLDLTIFNRSTKISFRMVYDSFKDKIPYFIIGLVVIIFSFLAQSEYGALRDLSNVTFLSRLETAINNIFIYTSKIFLPIHLSTFYPHPEKPTYIIILYSLFILTWLFLAVTYFSKSKLFTFSVLFFIIQIIPMSGIFQVGSHSLANRYTYLPAVGIFFIVSISIYKLQRRSLSILISLTLVISLTTLSFSHIKVWKNNLSLWENSANVTEKNYFTALFYSKYLLESGREDDAVKYFYNVIGVKDRYYADKAISQFSELLIDHKKYIEAKTILDAGAKYKYKGEGIYRQLALLEYFYFNNKERGVRIIKAVIKIFPSNLRANRIYAKILIDQKKYNQALDVLNAMKNFKKKRHEDFDSKIKKDIELIEKLVSKNI